MSSVTNKTELISGATIYKNYKLAMHLIHPDDVKEFFSTLRVYRSSMQREIFSPENEYYIVPWHDAETGIVDGWVETGFSDDEEDKKLATFTTDKPTDAEIDAGQWEPYQKFRKHVLNKRIMSYLYMVKMHLYKFGDQAYANMGTILPTIPEALIGGVTNLRKIDIIEDPDYLRAKEEDPTLKPTTIRLYPRKVIGVTKASKNFESICWIGWEKTLLDPDHVMEFNKDGKMTIDPVLEIQFSEFLDALDEAFEANEIWKVYKQMADIMDNAKFRAKQFQNDIAITLNETLETLEAYGARFKRDLLALGQTTRTLHDEFINLKDSIFVVENSLKEDGLLNTIKTTIDDMREEITFLDNLVDERVQQLNTTQNYAQTAKATLWRRISEVEKRVKKTGVTKLVELYMKEYKDGKIIQIEKQLEEMATIIEEE